MISRFAVGDIKLYLMKSMEKEDGGDDEGQGTEEPQNPEDPQEPAEPGNTGEGGDGNNTEESGEPENGSFPVIPVIIAGIMLLAAGAMFAIRKLIK